MDKIQDQIPQGQQGLNKEEEENKSWYSAYTEPAWRWVEDTYLKYFGENRASYGTKGNLKTSQSKG